MKRAVLAFTVLALSIGWVQQAKAQLIYSYITENVSTTNVAVDVNAQADFSLSNGILTVTLTNSLQNPANFEQLISGLLFNVNVSGSIMSPSLTTPKDSLGYFSQMSNSYTVSTGSLTSWTVSALTTTPNIDLTTNAGGKYPKYLIIGPDSQGGFSGTSNDKGIYSLATATNTFNNPYVLGSATFDLSNLGLTSLNQISDVEFQFGGTNLGGIVLVAGQLVPAVDPVPEPTGMVLMVIGILCLGVVVGLRRRALVMSTAV